eukprot:TRINITY_DN32186_c0_g1_i1.p2 TRINITY_DN32186_c0_g1~~TRINITY_DN32186_c0_g1_i1.p2  ORF type:complete len:162 (+),score=38.91 TRINITY_DN32186_c0_g1_i1:114-599(+)
MFVPIRELALLSNRERMATEVGLTCSMPLEGRTEMRIGKGWVEHERPDGKLFYVNSDTGARTWKRPEDQGVLEKQDFERCDGFVTKMKYEGRFPIGVDTLARDGSDCTAFLNRLYEANETKWAREQHSFGRADGGAGGAALPKAAAESLFKDNCDTYLPSK